MIKCVKSYKFNLCTSLERDGGNNGEAGDRFTLCYLHSTKRGRSFDGGSKMVTHIEENAAI